VSGRFEPRPVRKIEVGDFHLTGGQAAPVHTHAAPAFGYVSKGSIVYQVEGQPQRVLNAGDAFYEPAGPRILHFDNASQTDEVVFTDFNFEREGEPFIVFPTPPVNLKVDRRTFPTVEARDAQLGRIDVVAQTIAPGAAAARPVKPFPVMGYVAAGTIQLEGAEVAAGQSFSVPAGATGVSLANTSNVPARVVTFEPF
jgi:quercetin dioxygenase-like cupin family protein